MLVNNSLIKIDKEPIKKSIWPNYDKVTFIKDLLDQEGKLARKEYIEHKHNIIIPTMVYNSIISAIPAKWKKLIRENNTALNTHVFKEHRIQINETSKKIVEINTKDLYWHLIQNKGKRPTSEITWEEKVGLGFDDESWAKTYM
jgi:hypothetical protein